jgi:hypothetical protein
MALPTGKDDKLPDEWFTWIGRVVVEWARLERAVEQVIWGILDLKNDEFGTALTKQIPHLVHLHILVSLADQLLTPKGRDALQKLVNSITKLRPDRNLLVHGSWLPWTQPKILKIQAKKGVKKTFYEPTIPLLEELHRNVGKIADELEATRFKIGQWRV